MKTNSIDRFLTLREKVFFAIQKELQMDGHHKSYEGTFEITTCYPNYFDNANEPDFYTITLHCYVLGPKRHYEWVGKTLDEALDNAEREITEWLNETNREYKLYQKEN